MALYLVGDIQGCLSELKALLKQVNFNKAIDELWLVGDLVARGPDSLGTLRFIKALGNSAKIVLGNHDLHLLSVHAGIKKINTKDNLLPLLNAPDIDELINWLASQPLLRQLPSNKIFKNSQNIYMSHAGISPQWTIEEAKSQAKIAHEKLKSPERKKWLTLMYGEQPNSWHNVSTEIEKFRFTINSFTRMRYCFPDGSLEFTYKNSPDLTSEPLKPWYDHNNNLLNNTWFFGHWASLMGKCPQPNTYALDTGCVWGNYLTLIRYHDLKVFTEKSH